MFLLVSCMNTSNLLLYFVQVLCTVNPQNSEQKPKTKNFAGFHNHFPLCSHQCTCLLCHMLVGIVGTVLSKTLIDLSFVVLYRRSAFKQYQLWVSTGMLKNLLWCTGVQLYFPIQKLQYYRLVQKVHAFLRTTLREGCGQHWRDNPVRHFELVVIIYEVALDYTALTLSKNFPFYFQGKMLYKFKYFTKQLPRR